MASQLDDQDLIEKVRCLSPSRRAEVRDFVDFLRLREKEESGAREMSTLSEQAFASVWDNTADAEYDEL